MKDAPRGEDIAPVNSAGTADCYKRDFWGKENLKFSRPHYRLEKAARIINGLARDRRKCTLLDVGCGPATLMRLLSPDIQYHGIDIAIQDPAPNLIEADFLDKPISFGGKRFDLVVAQGVFEYMADLQSQKLAEIAQLLNEDGIFFVSYWNFGHRNKEVSKPFSNIQSIRAFRSTLGEHFNVDKCFPASHNWRHSSPNRKLVKAVNMHINMNIPLVSQILAVEYFFICSSRGQRIQEIGAN